VKRSLLLPGSIFVFAVALAAVAPGCGLQGEGERCDQLNGNDDCSAGLICVLGADLGQQSDVCCPDGAITDRRCAPTNNSVGGGGAGGSTTSAGGGGAGGSTTSAGGGGTGGTTTSTGGTGGAGGSGGSTTTGGTGGM